MLSRRYPSDRRGGGLLERQRKTSEIQPSDGEAPRAAQYPRSGQGQVERGLTASAWDSQIKQSIAHTEIGGRVPFTRAPGRRDIYEQGSRRDKDLPPADNCECGMDPDYAIRRVSVRRGNVPFDQATRFGVILSEHNNQRIRFDLAAIEIAKQRHE